VWESNRAALAEGAARSREHSFSRRTLPALRGPVGLALLDSEDQPGASGGAGARGGAPGKNHWSAIRCVRGGRGLALGRPTLTPAKGAAHRGVVAQNFGTGAGGPNLRRQGTTPAGAAQSPGPAGRFSKSGILSGASNAASDL